MATLTEQQYQAELLRQRQQEQRASADGQMNDAGNTEQKESSKKKGAKAKKPPRQPFPISPVEVGLWLFPAVTIDMFEFFGQTLAAIPIVGIPLAGASSVVGAVMSGIIFLVVGLWLIMEQITPTSPTGMRVFLVLGGTAFGNAIINWLPAWSGFFLWLFFKAYAKKVLPHEEKK